MGQLAFEHHAKLVGGTVVGKQHGKSAVAADRNGLRAIHVRAGFNDRLTGVLALGVDDDAQHHRRNALGWLRMLRQMRAVLFISGDALVQLLDLCRVFPQHQLLQCIPLAQMAGTEHIQLADLHI